MFRVKVSHGCKHLEKIVPEYIAETTGGIAVDSETELSSHLLSLRQSDPSALDTRSIFVILDRGRHGNVRFGVPLGLVNILLMLVRGHSEGYQERCNVDYMPSAGTLTFRLMSGGTYQNPSLDVGKRQLCHSAQLDRRRGRRPGYCRQL